MINLKERNFTRWIQVTESRPQMMAKVLISKYREQKSRNPNTRNSLKSVVLACAYLHIDDPKKIAKTLSANVRTVKRWLRYWKKAIEAQNREGLWTYSMEGKILESHTREELMTGFKRLGVTLKEFNRASQVCGGELE